MGSSVVKLVPFEINASTTEFASQALSEVQRAGSPNVIFGIAIKISLKPRIFSGRVVGFFDLKNQRHEGFCNKTAAENTEMSIFIGPASISLGGGVERGVHAWSPVKSQKARARVAILARRVDQVSRVTEP